MSFTADIDEIVAENRNRLLGAHPSWKRVRLREVAVLLNGFPFESAKFRKDKGTPLLRIRDVVRGQTETFYEGDFDRIFLVQPGELVVGMDGDFNSALWRGEPALLNQRVCKITTESSRYSPKFLEYVLTGYLAAINAQTPSVTVKHLSSRTISDIPLPQPPLDEQQHIVAEIEKQFTRLDAGVAAVTRVQSRLKRYRASVLKAACEGRLVPTEAKLARKENRSYETGEQLLQRIVKERREQWNGKGKYREALSAKIADLPQLSEGWTWATVEQLNPPERPCAYGVLQPGPNVPNGIPIVRVGDINNGKVDQTNLKLISPNIAARYPRTKLQGGEVAISLVGAIGRTAVIPTTLIDANTARAVGIIPLSKLVSSNWVEIWFRNPRKIAEMTSKSHEVARKTLNLEDVRAASVAVPPILEQERIVADAERRLSLIEEVETVVEANLRRAVRLRQAVLAQAFSGEISNGDGFL